MRARWGINGGGRKGVVRGSALPVLCESSEARAKREGAYLSCLEVPPFARRGGMAPTPRAEGGESRPASGVGVGEHIHLMPPYPFAHPSSYAFAGGGRRERVEERRGKRKVVFETVITFPLKRSRDLGTYLTNQEI